MSLRTRVAGLKRFLLAASIFASGCAKMEHEHHCDCLRIDSPIRVEFRDSIRDLRESLKRGAVRPANLIQLPEGVDANVHVLPALPNDGDSVVLEVGKEFYMFQQTGYGIEHSRLSAPTGKYQKK